MDDAERPQGLHHAGGDRPAVRGASRSISARTTSSTPEFLEDRPNNKIPAIVDRDNGMSLMESGAILLYLAEKTGKFLADRSRALLEVMEWLMWQMGGFGPMLGQAHHFVHSIPARRPTPEERLARRPRGSMACSTGRLAGGLLVGDYSIADMAIWPWASRFAWQAVDLDDFPNVKRWYLAIAARPAVQRGYSVPKDMGPIPMP